MGGSGPLASAANLLRKHKCPYSHAVVTNKAAAELAKLRAQSLTPERRSEIASMGGKAKARRNAKLPRKKRK